VSQLLSAVEISRGTADIIEESTTANPSLERQAAFDLAWEKWNVASQADLVKMEKAAGEDTSDWTGGNPYNQSSPGILVMFAIFGLVNSAQVLVQERKTRTLQRMMTTSMRRWEIVAGHLLAMFLVVFGQTALLVIFGQWVLDVNYLREPMGTLLIAVTMGLWVASVGLLIGVVAKGDDQVVLYAMVAMFLFSALGGTWFPLEMAGGAFAALGKIMPSAYAMNGLQNILIRGLSLDSIWLPAAILMAYALAFFAVAVWRFRENVG
jgi:ABC-2 type transport system permease protein